MRWSREAQGRGPAPRAARHGGSAPGHFHGPTPRARTGGVDSEGAEVTTAFFLKETQTSAAGRGLGPDLPPVPDPGQRPGRVTGPGRGDRWRPSVRPVCLPTRHVGGRVWRPVSVVRFPGFCSAPPPSLLGEVQRPRAEQAPHGDATGRGPSGAGRTRKAEAPSGPRHPKENAGTDPLPTTLTRGFVFIYFF